MKRPAHAIGRAACLAGGVLCFAAFALPLTVRVLNIGSLFWLCASAVLLMLGGFPRQAAALWHWCSAKWLRRIVRSMLLIAVCAGFCLCTVLSGLMLWAVADTPADDGATVVVLGAGLNGDQPSRMLADRLKAAAVFLKEHPASHCIVSGGQGLDEQLPEAIVMKRYLIFLGIAEERITEEAASANTRENLLFSRALIEQNGLSPSIVIVTQEFHQYRAGRYAAAAGFTDTAALSCASPLPLLPCYWAREWFAILALWLL